MNGKSLTRWLVLLVVLFLLTPALHAREHKEAKRLRQSGAIVPLEQVLSHAQQRKPGRALDVRLRKGKRPIYEIEWLQRDGEVRVLRYNARTGRPLRR